MPERGWAVFGKAGVRGGPLSLKANVWDGIDVLSQSQCVSQYLQL